MSGWQIAILIKPLALLCMFAPGAVIVWYVRNRMPDCRLKRFFLIRWEV